MPVGQTAPKASRTRALRADRDSYRAPALEKGFEILELLAGVDEPLSVTAIVKRLGRSTGELFRMVLVLEKLGFLVQTDEGYILTDKLFRMGLSRPPIRNLVELSLPEMRQLSVETRQSCHVVLPSAGDIVVVARMEAPEQIGITVRVGYRQPMYHTGSGTVLYAFQPSGIREEWEELFQPRPRRAELAAFRTNAAAAERDGFVCQPSAVIDGVMDIGAPILRGDRAAAALSIPYIQTRTRPTELDACVAAICTAAARISGMLTSGDNRV